MGHSKNHKPLSPITAIFKRPSFQEMLSLTSRKILPKLIMSLCGLRMVRLKIEPLRKELINDEPETDPWRRKIILKAKNWSRKRMKIMQPMALKIVSVLLFMEGFDVRPGFTKRLFSVGRAHLPLQRRLKMKHGLTLRPQRGRTRAYG